MLQSAPGGRAGCLSPIIDPAVQIRILSDDLRKLSQSLEEISAQRNRDFDSLYQQLKEIDFAERSLKEHKREFKDFFQWAKRDNTALPSLDKHHDQMRLHGRRLEDQQASARKAVKDLSRPHVRPLHIFDMPDEILVTICEVLSIWGSHNNRVPRYIRDASDIKNLRLSCRRLCNTSSHLLVSSLSVEISSRRSLYEFEEISRHPIVSKHIRTVQISLDFYDSKLTADFSAFTDYAIEKLRRETLHVERRAALGVGSHSISSEQIQKNIRLGKAVLRVWESVARGKPDRRAGDHDHRELLPRIHDKYVFRHLAQKSSQNVFVERFAAAMARMPLAKKLEIRDDGAGSRRKETDYFHAPHRNAVYTAISRNLLLPLQWQEASQYKVGPPPAELASTVLLAIHKAGVSLKKLNIQLSSPEDLSILALSDEKRLELTASLQTLQDLRFVMYSNERHFWPPLPIRKPAEKEGLQNFIRAILNTGNLDTLELSLSFLEFQTREQEGYFSIGPAIDCPTWQRLSKIELGEISLHLEELERLLRQLNPENRSLSFDNVRLLSGDWADVLDILRERRILHAVIRCPLGGKRDGFSRRRKHEVFGRQGDHPAADTRYFSYISGCLDQNPLRV